MNTGRMLKILYECLLVEGTKTDETTYLKMTEFRFMCDSSKKASK